MITFTNPIKYTNQDFDEYQAACRYLGDDHVAWLLKQGKPEVERRIWGKWFANDLEGINAYCCIERWHWAN